MTTETKTPPDSEKNAPPVAKLKVGLVTASIWELETGFYTVSFERRYRDKNGEWQTAHSYDAGDLAELRMVADLAHDKLIELYRGNK
jgi:hypothetical protein